MKSKILTGVLSFFIAFGLWLYVITVVSPGSEKTIHNIRVDVQGERVLNDRDLCITNHPEETTVDLILAGNRIDLNKLSNQNITVTVDYSNISEPGEYQQPYTITFPGEIASDAITVQKRNPGTIKVVVETRVTEKIPVEVTVGETDEGYVADVENIQHPESLWITGPERIVKKIKAARVDIDLTGRYERLDGYVPYELYDKDGNILTEAETDLLSDGQEEEGAKGSVYVKLRVAPIKTIDVKATIKNGGGATAQDVQITYFPEQITVSGKLQPLLEGQTVLPDIDLSKLTEQTNKLTLELELPPDVVCESGETTVDVEIVFPDLRTKELVISDFTVEGVASNQEATVNTKSVKVLFRGTKAAVDALSTGDVKAVVSFRDGKLGTIERVLTITITDKDKKVGVLGTYNVETTLKEKG